MSERKNCLQCAHYYSTYDPSKPRGCRLYGFESTQFPNLVVKRESGAECGGYSPSKRAKKLQEEQKSSLNDPRYW